MMKTGESDEIKEQLKVHIDALADEMIADTIKIISFQTVSGGTPAQEEKYKTEIPACMDWLREKAEQYGFTFQVWDGRVAEIEWKAELDFPECPIKSVGIASHIDVVTPVGTWKYGPFNGTVDEHGVLYGRGIQDDKGPLIQSLYGMIACRKAGIKLPCDVRIIIGTSEETGDWSDVEHYLKVRGVPDVSFTPDADFPIIIGEKGMLNFTIKATWPKVAPDEETQMEFVSLKGGERENIIPSMAESVLRFPVENKTEVMKELVRETTRFTVENDSANVTLIPNNEENSSDKGYYEALVSFIGKAAHSSRPDAGHNAIIDALRFYGDVETIPASVRSFIQFLGFLGSAEDGANLQIDSHHDFVGDTTLALTLLTIGQEGGQATLNIRPTMGMPMTEVLGKLGAAAKVFEESTGISLELDDDGRALDAIYLDPNEPGVAKFLASLQQAYHTVTGKEGELQSTGGTTYAKAIPNCCAFGPVLIGVDGELAHQADERLSVDSIKRNALIYGLSMALLAN